MNPSACSDADALQLSVRVGWADVCTLDSDVMATVGDVSVTSTSAHRMTAGSPSVAQGTCYEKRPWNTLERHYWTRTAAPFGPLADVYSDYKHAFDD